VGAAVAFGNFHMALLISAITFIVLRLFTPLKTGADQDGDAIS
jgi:hypothetical protein